MKQQRIIQIVAYSIIAYVVLFIIWWASLLIRTEQEQFNLEKQTIELRETYDDVSIVDLEMRLQKTKKMIIYEVFFFLLILFLASWYVIRMINNQKGLTNLKRNFLLATTHELKTPLASLKLNLQTFKNNSSLPVSAQEMLIENSVSDVNRLSNLIDNILLASKIDAHDYQFSRLPISLTTTIANVVRQRNSDRVTFNVENDYQILADETAMKVVIMNLIDNALKYSQGRVDIGLQKQNESIELRIADNGIGIPLKEQQKVFQRFYRIEDERTRSTQGTGLGLYLVHSMVLANNGTVEIEENEPNGTIFVIKLPEYAQTA